MKIEKNGQSVAEFEYDRRGRISDVKLPDGRHYQFRYDYDRADTRRIVRAILTAPDRSTAKFDFPPS
jgi:YD repeat-containing protein